MLLASLLNDNLLSCNLLHGHLMLGYLRVLLGSLDEGLLLLLLDKCRDPSGGLRYSRVSSRVGSTHWHTCWVIDYGHTGRVNHWIADWVVHGRRN